MKTMGNLPVPAHEELSEVMLYTYVEKDHHWNDKVNWVEIAFYSKLFTVFLLIFPTSLHFTSPHPKSNEVTPSNLSSILLLSFFLSLPHQLPSLFDRTVEESYLGAAMFSQPADAANGTTAKEREAKLLTRINK